MECTALRDCSIHPLPTIDPRTIVLERQRHTQLGLTDVEAAAFVSPIGAGLPEASNYESLSMRSFVHMKHDLYALRFTLSFVSVWIAFQRFCLLLGFGTSEIRNLVNMARCVANVHNVSLRRQPV